MLSKENLKAAHELHRELGDSWGHADRGLDRLKRHFPSNTRRSDVLVKASAIDKLYSTRAGNIYWVANAVIAVFEDLKEADTDVAVVDAISTAKRRHHPGSDHCHSFASKYCHFFVSDKRFPIFDSFALSAVNDLLGGRQYGLSRNRSPYGDFYERVQRLRARDSLNGVGVRELDRYLWLWGQWLAQRNKSVRVVNADVYDLFTSKDSEVQERLRRLHPACVA